jgi:hypothetical protein
MPEPSLKLRLRVSLAPVRAAAQPDRWNRFGARRLFAPMRQEPDRAPREHPSFQDPDRACAVRDEQIDQARQVMRQSRVTLWAPVAKDEDRPRA